MRLCNFASGSKGNCTYIETSKSKILVDLGVNLSYVESCLKEMGLSGKDIDGIVLSHEHNDHIKGLQYFVRKYKTPVYVHNSLYEYFYFQVKDVAENLHTFADIFEINDLKIIPIDLPHDSIHCNGFKFVEKNAIASIITDCGNMTSTVYNSIKGSALVYLESNYDEEMLYACKYPTWLKKRIASKTGHLSNEDCAKVIEQLALNGTRQIVLAHISENSNTPLLAYNTAKAYLHTKNIIEGVHVRIDVASQYNRDTIFKISAD